jgi:hypothetical protein
VAGFRTIQASASQICRLCSPRTKSRFQIRSITNLCHPATYLALPSSIGLECSMKQPEGLDLQKELSGARNRGIRYSQFFENEETRLVVIELRRLRLSYRKFTNNCTALSGLCNTRLWMRTTVTSTSLGVRISARESSMC